MTSNIGTKKSSAGVSAINNSGAHMSSNFSRKKSKAGLNNQVAGSNNGSQLGAAIGGGNYSTINAGSWVNTSQAKKNSNQPNKS